MEPNKSITIENIFDLQEKCLNRAVLQLEDRYSFIKECIEFLINRHIYEEHLTEEDREKINIIHSLLNDAVSNLIVCCKSALYGACIESLSLLRVSLETITIMTWKIEKGEFAETVSFNTAKQQIKAKEDIHKLYGYLSDKIVHINNRSDKYRYFEINGETYPRIGMAIDPDGTKIVLGELMRAILYLVRILSDFYNSKREVVGEEYFKKKDALEQKYSEFQNSN
ncbi:MAG: hypothetical protein WA277_13775 [Nitrospirota bacterium]